MARFSNISPKIKYLILGLEGIFYFSIPYFIWEMLPSMHLWSTWHVVIGGVVLAFIGAIPSLIWPSYWRFMVIGLSFLAQILLNLTCQGQGCVGLPIMIIGIMAIPFIFAGSVLGFLLTLFNHFTKQAAKKGKNEGESQNR